MKKVFLHYTLYNNLILFGFHDLSYTNVTMVNIFNMCVCVYIRFVDLPIYGFIIVINRGSRP